MPSRREEIEAQIKQLVFDQEFHRLCVKQIQDKLMELSDEYDRLLGGGNNA